MVPRVGVAPDDAPADAFSARALLEIEKPLEALDFLTVLLGLGDEFAQLGILLAEASVSASWASLMPEEAEAPTNFRGAAIEPTAP